MISAINPYFIILPIVLVQYISATFALVRLARARLSTPKYVAWNLFILIVFFVGSIAFFIYDAVRKKPEDDDGGDTALQKTQAADTEKVALIDKESENVASDKDL